MLSQKALFMGQVEHTKNHTWNEIMDWPQLASEWIKNLMI